MEPLVHRHLGEGHIGTVNDAAERCRGYPARPKLLDLTAIQLDHDRLVWGKYRKSGRVRIVGGRRIAPPPEVQPGVQAIFERGQGVGPQSM
jgi:hypothetical protein